MGWLRDICLPQVLAALGKIHDLMGALYRASFALSGAEQIVNRSATMQRRKS
jgi:hypothetical protein